MTDATNFPPGDEALTATDDSPVDEAKAAAFRAMMARAATKSAADAVKMQLEAQRKRQAADHLEARGDRVTPRFERAEADRLEQEASLILDPVMHATGPVTVGNGGEFAHGTTAMAPFVDTVRERPDMLTIDASRQRMELVDKANVLELSLDAAATIQPRNSLEKMLAHQMAATHAMAMELQAEARDLLQRYKRTGCVHQPLSIEAGRMANCAARMMGTFQNGLLTLARLRGGGQQVVTVQHVNVSGGQAVVAGAVKARAKRRKGER
jgi:hypothetical protein